jgi:tetratricopeptide (TPR) repeat protein
MSRLTAAGDNLSLADMLEIDSACDRFETAWRSGERPELGAFLAEASEAARPRLFRELLTLELEYQIHRGMKPDAVDYHGRFPEQADTVAAVFAQFEPSARTHYTPRSAHADRAAQVVLVESSGNQTTLPGDALPRADLSEEALEALRAAGYEVLGELGRGGMGVVYLAHKIALNRRCALKMIHASANIAPAASARFRAEAETIARLRHPGIVQVYNVGDVRGLPYFELEYLSGGSLDRRLDGTPWSAANAAELVETLAHAIAEAHLQGVVHRDLKPANILLDADLRPKVADFGLAKLLDSGDGLTKTHTVIGSPSYMAPEQAEGNSRLVGPTTDVYALGAIFYELLTGRPPFRAATAVETLVQVRDVDAIPPSRFQPGLPRAAEIICLKCLEKVPARRYATAEALAEDLHRFRAGESILAHPAPPWEQAWRWTRRRPAVAAALAISAIALFVLLGGGAYYNARLRQEAAKARAAQVLAESQRNLALNAFDQLVYDLQERLRDTAATRAARRSLLDTAIKGLDKIAASTEGSAPDLSRAVAHQKLGDIYRQIGRSREARRQLDSARQLAEKIAVSAPQDLAVAECLRDALAGLGAVSVQQQRYEEAKELLRRVVPLAEQIAQRDRYREGAQRGLIEAYLELGRAHGFNGERTAAEACYRKMHDLAERWVQEQPGNLLARDLLATSFRKLADERKLVGDYPAARAYYQSAIAIGRNVLAADPDNFVFNRHLAVVTDDLAGVAHNQGRIPEARALFEESTRRFAGQVQADAEDVESQFRLMHAESRFARLERDDLQFARAAELYQSALERRLRLGPHGAPGTSDPEPQAVQLLRAEIAACEQAPRALADPGFTRSRPTPEACILLALRVRALTAQGRESEALEAAGALCDLAVHDTVTFYLQAQGLSACVRLLDDSRWTQAQAQDPAREALRRRCAERALAALAQTLEGGLDEVTASAYQDTIAPLRGYPGYQQVAARLADPGPARASAGPTSRSDDR